MNFFARVCCYKLMIRKYLPLLWGGLRQTAFRMTIRFYIFGENSTTSCTRNIKITRVRERKREGVGREGRWKRSVRIRSEKQPARALVFCSYSCPGARFCNLAQRNEAFFFDRETAAHVARVRLHSGF